MFQHVVVPVPNGTGFVAHPLPAPQPERFERLPVNLSPDEIRRMVVELLG